jgi:hypothetical protein
VTSAVDAIDSVDCCFSEIGSVDATADATADARPPPTRPFGFVVFIVFKVNISPSLGIAAAAAAAAAGTVFMEAGGLEFALTTEAQDFIECWNAINYFFNVKKINLSFYNL